MEDKFRELKNEISGEIILPTDPNYSEFSGSFHKPGSPAVIVRVKTNEDVAKAIRFSKENELILSVRSGGHGFAGISTNEGGVVIDLSLFDKVELIDETNSIVRIGSGVRWGEAMQELAKYGLALSSGDTKQVGVGGLTLGGGIGWMVRKYGLTIDSLVGAEIVTADGKILKLNKDENPDLFWAIRGGGGNFGVVTSFEFEAEKETDIVAGTVIFNISEKETIVRKWGEYMSKAPLELTSTLMLLPSFGPDAPPQLMLLVCYAGGDEAKANEVIKPLLEMGTIVSQDIKKKPYLEMLEDAHPPVGMKVLGDNGFIKTLKPEIISAIVNNFGKADSPMIQLRSVGGAMNNLKPGETAFAHRGNEIFVIMAVFGQETTTHEELYARSQKAWEPLEPFINGAYINFQTDTLEASVARAYPKETYEKLAQIKAKYDPENIFNRNANIRPA